ncbi:hypothetical protein FRC16_007580, partial [Serendipita sp. 398]
VGCECDGFGRENDPVFVWEFDRRYFRWTGFVENGEISTDLVGLLGPVCVGVWVVLYSRCSYARERSSRVVTHYGERDRSSLSSPRHRSPSGDATQGHGDFDFHDGPLTLSGRYGRNLDWICSVSVWFAQEVTEDRGLSSVDVWDDKRRENVVEDRTCRSERASVACVYEVDCSHLVSRRGLSMTQSESNWVGFFFCSVLTLYTLSPSLACLLACRIVYCAISFIGLLLVIPVRQYSLQRQVRHGVKETRRGSMQGPEEMETPTIANTSPSPSRAEPNLDLEKGEGGGAAASGGGGLIEQDDTIEEGPIRTVLATPRKETGEGDVRR